MTIASSAPYGETRFSEAHLPEAFAAQRFR
jgi:hypothetical protein